MTEARGGNGRQKVALAALGVAAAIAAGSIALHATGGKGGATEPPATATGMPHADPQLMIRSLEDRMRADPRDAEGWRTLGWSYFQVSRFRDAAGAYARLVALRPHDAAGWSALGEAQTLSGNAVDATAHDAFARAVAIDPKDARARYFLAVEKDLHGDHKGAVDDWIALLRDSPPDAPYAQSVHDLVQQVAAREHLDVAGRLPEVRPPAAGGAEVASAGIPGPSPEQMSAAAQLTPSQQDAMVRSMVDGLAARLRANPKDADGWIRLMRARTVQGDTAGAQGALAGGRRAFADDPVTAARLEEAARTLGIAG